MANQYGLFWNSESGDRVYDADSFAEWLDHFFTTGVFEGELFTSANNSMDISVSSGYANVKGKVRLFETDTTLTIEPANALYPRIDNVVVERNNTNREITLKVVTGTYSGSIPTAVEPTRTEAIYQLVIARVLVNAGATQITQANITDTRMDSDLCGYVTGTVDEIDYSQISAQFTSYLQQFQEDNLDAFNTWFETIKGILGKDEAAKLLAMIETNQTAIEDIKTNYATIEYTDNKVEKVTPTIRTNITVSVTPTKMSSYQSWDTENKYGYSASIAVSGLTTNSMVQNIVMTDTLLNSVAPIVATNTDSLIFYVEDETALSGTIYTLITSEVS